jgi:hypothetical protein
VTARIVVPQLDAWAAVMAGAVRVLRIVCRRHRPPNRDGARRRATAPGLLAALAEDEGAGAQTCVVCAGDKACRFEAPGSAVPLGRLFARTGGDA